MKNPIILSLLPGGKKLSFPGLAADRFLELNLNNSKVIEGRNL